MVTLKAYTNYREYLRDIYLRRKAEDPAFSYRALARLVGFKTAGFFSRILSGEKNISAQTAAKFIRFLKLGPGDAEYFLDLVRFNQARTHAERKTSLARLLNRRNPWLKETGANQYRFYEKWYYPIIREILHTLPFKDDYRALARTIVPAVSSTEAQEAVAFLEAGGFIRRNPEGYCYLVDKFLNAGPDISSVSIHTFQMATMDLGKKALERFSPAERDISTLTLTLSKDGVGRMKERLADFRSELLEIAKKDTRVDQVYQLNFQIFPVSGKMGAGR